MNTTRTEELQQVGDHPGIKVRSFLAEQAYIDEQKLRENDHKAHWSTCTQSYLFGRGLKELDELAIAMLLNEGVPSECADVRNFFFMIADNFRAGRHDVQEFLATIGYNIDKRVAFLGRNKIVLAHTAKVPLAFVDELICCRHRQGELELTPQHIEWIKAIAFVLDMHLFQLLELRGGEL